MPRIEWRFARNGIARWRLRQLATFGVIGLTVLAASADAKATDGKAVSAAIDAAAARYVAENPRAAAIAIGVVYGPASYQVRRGTLEPGKVRPPRADTLYPVASITKTFTGTLLAQAVVEKRLALSDDVRKYLDSDYPNLSFDGRAILISDLLDHRSGLPFLFPDRPELEPDFQGDPRPHAVRVNEVMKTYGRDEFFGDLHKLKLTAQPGSRYAYSNAAAQLAGYILENVYLRSYAQLLQAKILGPLRMGSSTIALSRATRRRLAPGWDDRGRLAVLPEGAEAAGAVLSTTADMLKYVRWQVEEADPAIKLSHQRVWTAKAPIFGGQGTFGVGLNWQVAELGGRRAIFQDGMIEGYSALVVIEPELKLGVVIMTNQLDQQSAAAIRSLTQDLLRSIDPDAVPLP